MKTSTYNQAGFGHIAAVFVLLFVGIAGFAGYKVVTMDKTADSSSSATVSPKVPEKISDVEDLQQTGVALDNSGASLNGGLDDAALDADLSDML